MEPFLDAVRRFSDWHLPCRGWYRMLVVGTDAGDVVRLLEDRGYAVTVVERPDEAEGRFDAAFWLDRADAEGAARALRPRLRRRGLLVGGPARARGFARGDDLGEGVTTLVKHGIFGGLFSR